MRSSEINIMSSMFKRDRVFPKTAKKNTLWVPTNCWSWLLLYHVRMISGRFLVVLYSWKIHQIIRYLCEIQKIGGWGHLAFDLWSCGAQLNHPLCHISAFNQTCQIKFINNKTSSSFCYQNAFLQEVKQTSATMFEMQWTAIWRRKSLQRKHKNNFEGKEEEKQPN